LLLSLLRALPGIFGLGRGASTTPAGGGATPSPGTGGGTPGPVSGGTATTLPPPPNQPPRIRWTSPIASPSGVPVPLRYALEDDESDPIRIEVQYSLDGGATFIPATEDDAVATEGTTALSSAPGGVDHVFAWHAKQDLNGRAAAGVIVQVKTFDANPGATITSAPFDVDARVVGMPSRPRVNPFRPFLTGQNVPVRFVVGDRDGQPVRVLVEYRQGTGAWMPATPSLASDQMDLLPAPDVEADYRFIWNAGQDLANQTGSVELRFTALKGNVAGPARTTGPFSLDTTIPAPAASVFTPPPARTPTIDIVSTNPIEGVHGKLLPEVLRVRIVDSSGQPVAGMRVSFTQGANSIPLEFESDRDLWEVTDSLGQAAIRVRIAAGAIGAGEVVVQLPGFPGHKKSLRITSKAPVIYHNNLPAMPLIHGQRYDITLGYGDPNTPAWMAEGFNPLRLKVEATNALVSHALLPIPEKPDYTGTARILGFVPLFDAAAAGPPPAPGSTTTTSATSTAGKLRVSDPANPAVFVDIPFTVASPTSSRRTGRSSRAPYPTRLVPNTGVPGTQVGYPGLTLKQVFQVHLTDGAHVFQGALNNFIGCNVTPQPMTLNVEWAASSGLLSTQSTPPATATNRLQTNIATPVHFTPAGEGPWYVTVFVSDSVIDPHPVRITYMSGTTPVCERDNAFGVNSSFSFIVQEPADVKVMPTQAPAPGAPAPTALDTIRPGEPWHVEIGGLSECEPGGQPADLRVTSALHRGGSIPAYTGYPYPFDQPLALTLNATRNGLTSASLTAVRGEPATMVANAHAVIPGAWLRIHADAVEYSLPVPGRPHRRLVTNGAESLEEAPAGTSPAAGAFNSVLLHSGELVYRAHCIGMTDRPRMLSISRTHRSHARTDGPLGPGWELEHCGGLDVSRSRGLRWFTGLGRVIDFPALAPPPGVFVELRTNLAITADQSPYEIRDTHGNWMHFHVDGSPRFLMDLSDNRTRYEYNAQGQLTAIKGAWHNRFTLTYWKKGDPVDKEVYGRLSSIVDHIGREVNFEYYPAGSTTDGLPGWLRTVDHSSPQVGKTLVDGNPVADFRAPETYLYEINPNDPLEARVKQILDWNLDVRLENKYDAFRRVEKQTTDEKGDYTFGYATTARATTFSDRKRRTTLFEFADTPYPNAAAPSKITLRRDAALHPGKPDLVTTLTHRPWGARASITHAAGVVEEFWYDEASPYPRSRGNLLKHRVRDASGAAARLSAFEYDDRFNVVARFYSPRAFAAGENPKAYLTYYNHDSQGRLTRIVSPRTLHGVIQPVGARRRVLWIDDEPGREYSYNAFGLLKELIDEQGVVTEYQYWDVANPYGQQISGPTSPDAGGMLARVTRDTRQTADRSLYLPGVALAPMQSMLVYSALGDLFATIDPLGTRTLTPRNGLHQVYDVEQYAALANPARRAQMWDEFGNLAQIEITLPQAPGRPAGKLTDTTFWNRPDRKWEHHVVYQPFAAAGGAAKG
jgi:YD repeat-containing protein